MNGYIKLHRKIIEWGWYDDANTVRLFLHLLLTVNWEAKSWRGIEIQPGQIVTSLPNLASQTNLTVSQVRTCLDKLKLTSEIAYETTHHYSLITITKWALYQSDDEAVAQQIARNIADQSQTNRRPVADQSQQLKKEKKERKEEGKKIYGRFQNVRLTDEEYEKLGQAVVADIEKLSAYMKSHGKTYKDHYATIINWREMDKKRNAQKTAGNFTPRDYTDEQLNGCYEEVTP